MTKEVLVPNTNGGVRYPAVHVKLVGSNGNAFAIMGKVSQAMRRAGVSSSEVSSFTKEAMSGDYDNLLQTCMRWVNAD